MECPCCCDSYPLDQMIQCRDEGHLFCNTCLVSYANNQIFGNDNLGVHKTTKKLSLELQCLQGDCPSYFERVFLERALPPRLLQHYDSVQLKLSIASAGLSDTVCACPKCDFCVEVPVGQNIVQCPVASCRFASCRECGEAAHIPLRYVVQCRPCTEARWCLLTLVQF
jgi:E3 ubiquitin-protein ligase RNF216